jgi:hypothetical protein
LVLKINQGFSEDFVTPATGFSGLSFVNPDGVQLDGVQLTPALVSAPTLRCPESALARPSRSPCSPCRAPCPRHTGVRCNSKMRRRNRQGAGGGEDVEAAVRAAAGSIQRRLDEYPEPGALLADAEFVATSLRLAEADVPFEIVERLGRSGNAVVGAMAHRAAALRDDVPGEWVAWAFRTLKEVYAGELACLLQLVERHAEPPLIARVLAQSADHWSWGWSLDVVRDFVGRRVRAGETATSADLAQAVDEANEQRMADVVAKLEGTLPEDAVRAFEQLKRGRARLEFLPVGRTDSRTTTRAPPADGDRRTGRGRRCAGGRAPTAGPPFGGRRRIARRRQVGGDRGGASQPPPGGLARVGSGGSGGERRADVHRAARGTRA